MNRMKKGEFNSKKKGETGKLKVVARDRSRGGGGENGASPAVSAIKGAVLPRGGWGKRKQHCRVIRKKASN